ncbi:potassium channel KAT1 [Cinnamomum micranthum f. kanehirae]|uniref:Potassium channel KAT1 n=1 Tax=Cinnamomum micranthum f. kanehirae TaxID=337451 RepID=A0A3S3MJU8_9MAGN|nr:potassium channel KAT1 [Cinnamomum micranthum f. kanehirae]
MDFMQPKCKIEQVKNNSSKTYREIEILSTHKADKIASVHDRNTDMLNLTLTDHVHTIQGSGKATAGEMFGEIGVLCHRPQPFTARTSELCANPKTKQNYTHEYYSGKYRRRKYCHEQLFTANEEIHKYWSATEKTKDPKRMAKWRAYRRQQVVPINSSIIEKSLEGILCKDAENVLKFLGCLPTKGVNGEKAEIDDIGVIRDGDHLFLLENDSEIMDSN